MKREQMVENQKRIISGSALKMTERNDVEKRK